MISVGVAFGPTADAFSSRLLGDATVRRIHYYPRVLRVASYVRAQTEQPVRLEAAAAVAGMTPTSFSRYFSEKVGISFLVFVKTIRIARAIEEIERNDCAIAAIAERCGYASVASFSRAFREVIGATPSEYRRLALDR